MLAYLEHFRSKMRIAVVYGANKHDTNTVIYKTVNPRPWKSYRDVAQDIQSALFRAGFQYVTLLPDDMALPQRLKDEDIHLVWLNTAGVQGYNPLSHTAAMLEMLGIPYIGHSPLNASVLDNKDMFKRALQALNIPTAPFITWHPSHGPLSTGTGSRFRQVFQDYNGPFIVKPVSGRASLNISLVDSAHKLPFVALDLVRESHNMVMIETFLPGREYSVAVCGGKLYQAGTLTSGTQPFAFATIERLLEPGEPIFTSMDTRAITHDRLRILVDDEPERAILVALARQIYLEFNLGSLVRVDVRADKNGTLQVLEANPKPDLSAGDGTRTGLISASLTQHDLSYHDLILSLLVDRLDYLLRYTPESVTHLVEMLV